jgi:hypothetical protein
LVTLPASFDPNAATYIAAVTAADGQELPPSVQLAINDFVLGCKADGIWNAIKAACFLSGPRTLTGALIPLVGAAPTNVNFVSGDYVAKTGLKGNGAKSLTANRFNSEDPQNSNHNAVYITELGATNGTALMGSGFSGAGSNTLERSSIDATNSRNRSGSNGSKSEFGVGLIGMSRSTASQYVLRSVGTDQVINITSDTPNTQAVQVYRRGGVFGISDDRLAFYSIGESLNLAQLDSRLTTYMTAINAATY